MSTEVNCANGSTETEHFVIDGTGNNDRPTVVASKAADSSLGANASAASGTAGSPGTQQQAGTPSSGCRSQKSKKRQNQKTFSLLDIFDMHKGIGSWADAAAADVEKPSSLSALQKTPELEQPPTGTSASQGDWNQCPHPDENRHLPPPSRASHSRNVDLASLPDRPPFEAKVANINYKSSDDDLFFFFGGGRNVVDIRSEGQGPKRGTAFVSFSSQEALANALSLNGTDLHGRSLRISLRDYQPRTTHRSNIGPNDGYGHYRNNGSYQHEGGYSTLPHPRRGPAPPLPPYPSYNSDSRDNRLPPQQFSSSRGRDNRRYDYDSRSVRPRPGSGNNQFYPRYVNRSFDSYGRPPRPPPYNENHFVHHVPELEHDDERSGTGRLRTESVRSSTTDGTERHERRKLHLQPRTKPLDRAEEDLPARPASIFGLAKPVDTYEKEKQAEERLRQEDEAFKAAEQRSRKSSSEHGASVPLSPVLLHGHVSIMKPPLPEGNENPPPPAAQENVSETFPKPAEEVEKPLPAAVLPQSVVAEERLLLSTAVSTPATTLPPPPGPGVPAVRRQSFSNYSEMPSDVRSTATLPRARNSYNRTFTRSRDAVRNQMSTPKQQTLQVRGGKSGTRRGGGSTANRDKRLTAGKEKAVGNEEAVKTDDQKQLESKPGFQQQVTSKEWKPDTVLTSTVAGKQQADQQHSERQHSKKEKKQAIVKEMPKYVEPKPFTFSSENKYAALLEADD